MMSHEDQMARLQSKAQGEVLRGRDQMRLEVMESLDRLIDTRSKMPDLNEMGS
jgi:hypothetical protein